MEKYLNTCASAKSKFYRKIFNSYKETIDYMRRRIYSESIFGLNYNHK